MKRFEWGAVAGLGIAGLLVAAQSAQANEAAKHGSTASEQTQQQSGSSTMGSSSTAQGQPGATTGSATGQTESGSRGSGMGGTSTGARPGEVTGAPAPSPEEKTSARATSPAGQPQNQLSGKIQQFDRVNRTLTLANSDKKLKLTDDTEVYKDGTRRSPGAIMEGDEVRASYSGSGDNLQIQRIDIVSAGSGSRESVSPGGTIGGSSNKPSSSPAPSRP